MVLEAGIAPDYILDEITFYEMDILFDNLWRKHKEEWEQTKRLVCTTVQMNSTKPVNPDELWILPWEKNIIKAGDTQEDIEAVQAEMKRIQDKLNNR